MASNRRRRFRGVSVGFGDEVSALGREDADGGGAEVSWAGKLRLRLRREDGEKGGAGFASPAAEATARSVDVSCKRRVDGKERGSLACGDDADEDEELRVT